MSFFYSCLAMPHNNNVTQCIHNKVVYFHSQTALLTALTSILCNKISALLLFLTGGCKQRANRTGRFLALFLLIVCAKLQRWMWDLKTARL